MVRYLFGKGSWVEKYEWQHSIIIVWHLILNYNWYSNSIVINATGAFLDTTAANSFVVKPIRGIAHGLGVGVMKWDSGTYEITYSTT